MWLEGALAAGAVFCGMLAVYQRFLVRNERRAISEHISKWTEQQEEKLSWSDSLVERLDRMEWAQELEPKLGRASISLRPTEYAMIVFAVGVGLFFVLYWFGVPLWLSISLATTITPLGSKLFLQSRRNVYVNRINDQLSEACRLLASATRAGLSIPQGLELVVKEMPPPIQHELGIAVRELQLGRNLEGALKDLLKRVNSQDLQVFVNALIIQRRAGGDVARVLSEMARTMEERKIISQTIQALMSQSKYSAYTLPLVSILITFFLSRLIEGFFDLFTSFLGIVILVIYVVLQIIGILLIRKISNIKV